MCWRRRRLTRLDDTALPQRWIQRFLRGELSLRLDAFYHHSNERVMPDLPLTVYVPGSPLRQPAKLLRSMLKDLLASRGLAWRLFIRDISAQFRQSILGYVWFFIPPLAAALPFIFLNSQGVVRMGDTPIPYGAYALVGTTIWQVFVDALTSPLKTVTAARQMLTRINFPREAILLAALAQVGFGVLIRVVLLAAVFLWFQIVPPATVFLVPVGLLGLILFGFMIGVLITPLGVLSRTSSRAFRSSRRS